MSVSIEKVQLMSRKEATLLAVLSLSKAAFGNCRQVREDV